MAASRTVTTEAGLVFQTAALEHAAEAYDANPTRENEQAHGRALLLALVACGDLPPSVLG